MLYLYRAVVFGPLVNDDVRRMPDLSAREMAMFVPLVFLVLWMGVYPSSVLNTVSPAVDKTIRIYQRGIEYAAEHELPKAENTAAKQTEGLTE